MTRILIVEDEPRIASFLCKGLGAQGYETEVAGDRAAAEVRWQEAPDLVLLDRGLPDGDGLELLDRLRRAGDRVPVIVLTARDSAEDREAGLAAGADDYVVKPFGFADLLARVRARLGA
jgi:two-component system, OmpR family, copper resistance phosphate regulon response regulator CusR